MSQGQNDWRYLGQYMRYLRPHKWVLAGSLALIPVVTLAHLFQPILIQKTIDQIIPDQDLQGLAGIVLMFGVLVILEFVGKSTQTFCFQYVGQKTVTQVRADLFAHVVQLAPSYFDRTPQGQVTTRLTSDIESLNDSFASGLVTLIGDLLTLIGIVGFMLYLNVNLTLMVFGLLVPILVVVNYFRKALRDFYFKIRSLMGVLNASLQEQLEGVRVVQAFQRECRNIQQFKRLNARYREATLGAVRFDAMLYSLMESASAIVVGVIIWFAWGQQGAGFVTVGVVVAFIDYTQKLFTPLKELSNKFAVLQHALAALEKIFGLFDIKEHISSGTQTLDQNGQNLDIQNLSFAYPSRPDSQILQEVSFQLRPGTVTAIVGPTGSGKSTVSRLISRLYEGYTGEIKLDGVESSKIDLDLYRSQFSVVTQDVKLFDASVWFNIGLGHPGISEDKIRQAANWVQLDAFIQSLPEGYDTVLSNTSSDWSAGQTQLLGFARALASPAPFLLLDEATAHVDTLSEQKIQAAIATVFAQKTVLVVAHRLSTIQSADQILVMRDGKIVERGTHSFLMDQGGFYTQLYQLQFAHLT